MYTRKRARGSYYAQDMRALTHGAFRHWVIADMIHIKHCISNAAAPRCAIVTLLSLPRRNTAWHTQHFSIAMLAIKYSHYQPHICLEMQLFTYSI